MVKVLDLGTSFEQSQAGRDDPSSKPAQNPPISKNVNF